MRVMIVASYFDSIVNFRGELISEMLARGCQVDILVPVPPCRPLRLDRPDLSAAQVSHINISRNGLNPFADFLLLVRLVYAMHRLRPDIVLAYTVKPVVYSMIAARIASLKASYALITGLGYAFSQGRPSLVSSVVRSLYRYTLRKATKVFFQNPDDLKELRELDLLEGSVRTVVLNGSGVDLDAFAAAVLPAGTPTFVMICRLLGDKGVREYVDAARRVRALHPGTRFKLVGWIDTNPDAIDQSELDDWVAEGTVEFLGKLDDVRPAIAASTVYVLPSYREGTPRTVLEAMAMGRPIITTDAPGCRETVIDGDNGFLVPVRSVDALVDAMLKFIEDPTLTQHMGRRSRQIAEDKYDVHKVNTVMLREMGITGEVEEGETRA